MAVGEWDRRELCPDGGCLGVIGADGHCKECGRSVTNWGNERDRGLKTESPADSEAEAEVDEDDDLDDEDDDEFEDDEDDDDDEYEDDDDDVDAPLDALDPSAPAALGSAADWNRRLLCPDGACIGVIGDDGTCKVCGKTAPGARKPARSVAAVTATPTPAPADAAPVESTAPTTPSEEAQLLAAATDLAASLVEDRKLCPDGACVGVIGTNGKCHLCGQEAA